MPRLATLALLATLAASGAAAQTVVYDTLEVSIGIAEVSYPGGSPSHPRVACAAYGTGTHDAPVSSGYSYHEWRDGEWVRASFGKLPLRNSQYSRSQIPAQIGVPAWDQPWPDRGTRRGAHYNNRGLNSASADPCEAFDSLFGGTPASSVASRLPTGRVIAVYGSSGPVASFTWEQTEGRLVTFDGSASWVPVDGQKGEPASYRWDIGDTPTEALNQHEYLAPGEHQVTLTVADADGNEGSVTKTITVTDHRIAVRSLPEEPGARYAVGDTLVVETTVENVGSQSVYDLTIPTTVVAKTDLPTYPAGATPASRALMVPVGQREPETRAVFAVGERVVVRDSFRVETADSYRLPGDEIAVEFIESRAYANAPYGIEVASLDSEEPVEIQRPCDGGGCATWTVEPLTYDVEIAFVVAYEETTEATVGRRIWDGSFGRNTKHVRATPSEGLTCMSGCAEVVVRVTDSRGEPVEGVEPVLRSALVGSPRVVTPDNAAGVVCRIQVEGGDEDQSCGAEATLRPTDEAGETRAYYWVPGLIEPGSARLTATATPAESRTESVGEADLAITPTRVDVGRQTVSVDAETSGYLANLRLAHRAVSPANAITEMCKDFGKGQLQRVPGASLEPDFLQGTKALADHVCGQLQDLALWFGAGGRLDPNDVAEGRAEIAGKVLVVFELARKLAELKAFEWTFREFGVPMDGTATLQLNPLDPPFIDPASDLGDAFRDAVFKGADDGTFQRVDETHLFDPVALSLDLFEVSHARALNGAGVSVRDEQGALFVRLREGDRVIFEALAKVGYRPGIWLLQDGAATIDGAASAGSTSLAVGGGRRTSAAPAITAGHVLALSPGTEVSEIVQVVTVAEGAAELSTPLRFDHPAGARVVVADSAAVGPPDAPTLTDFVAGVPGAPTTPTLRWATRLPASSYAVEVATDSLFADLVASADEIPDPAFTTPDLADGTLYFWRARASNSQGAGPWGRFGSFVVGAPLGDRLADAIDLGGTFPTAGGTFTAGATLEASEAAVGCAEGDNSVWFVVTPTETGPLTFDTLLSDFDTGLSLWTGAGHPLAERACADGDEDDQATDIAAGLSEYVIGADAGVPVYARVTGEGGTAGIAVLRVTSGGQPTPGDDGPAASTAVGPVYPNPSRGRATVPVTLATSGPLRVAVYDVLGREVAVAHDGPAAAGALAVEVGGGLAPGTYVVRVVGPGVSETRRLTVTR